MRKMASQYEYVQRGRVLKIINVFGEVDPVSQSIQVVAEMEKYHEELLPGMSGRATFTRNTIEEGSSKGFLGLKLSDNRIK